MAQEEIQTTIVVATAEPTIEAHPIEDMLALPEAPSAVMEAQQHQAAREDFCEFLKLYFEKRQDVFEHFQSPFMDTMCKFVNQPNRQETTEYGIHFTRNEPGASGIYKPFKKKGEWDTGSPLKDMYTTRDWSRRATALYGRFDDPFAAEDRQNAFAVVQAERDAGRRMINRFTRSLMPGAAQLQICSADGKVQETIPVRDFRISTPSGRPNFFLSVYNAGLPFGYAVQNFQFDNRYIAKCQKEARDLREAEVRFNLPSGTMNATCMSARTTISIVESYIGLHPKSTAQDVVALLRREEILF